MPRIRFLGDSPICSWLGVSFVRDQWIDEHHLGPEELARVAQHPHFEVENVSKPARPPEASAGKKA